MCMFVESVGISDAHYEMLTYVSKTIENFKCHNKVSFSYIILTNTDFFLFH